MKSNRDDQGDRAFMKAFVASGDSDHCSAKNQKQINKPDNQNDCTRVGRILRRTSLDELPQLVNILRGEMSLVGPRPNVPWEVEMYQLWHQARLDVLPGITGLAQVEGRSMLSFNEIARNDINYVMNYSTLLDIKILWKTVFNSLKGRGAG
jgi:lipopolysaccharide/colanic/teichoic acid biosynthesis glycosyltransferase